MDIKNLLLIEKYPQCSRVTSQLKYQTAFPNVTSEFIARGWGEYQDILGNTHTVYPGRKNRFDPKSSIFVCNSAIHVDTHPINYGTITWKDFPYKVGFNHTPSVVIWDIFLMIDLAEIAATKDVSKTQGSDFIYILTQKAYDTLMETPWEGTPLRDYVYSYLYDKIPRLVKSGNIVIVDFEPCQYWLSVVEPTITEKSDDLCVAVNWSNLKTRKMARNLIDRMKKLHDYTGKSIWIKLHNKNDNDTGIHNEFLQHDWIHIMTYAESVKYDIMDRHDYYFVDSTGFGFELAYRRPDAKIFYLDGLPAENKEFNGVMYQTYKGERMLPTHTDSDFLNGTDSSSYPRKLIEGYFPHKNPENIPNELTSLILDISQNRWGDIVK